MSVWNERYFVSRAVRKWVETLTRVPPEVVNASEPPADFESSVSYARWASFAGFPVQPIKGSRDRSVYSAVAAPERWRTWVSFSARAVPVAPQAAVFSWMDNATAATLSSVFISPSRVTVSPSSVV
jgi:hypothetical protein